MRTLPTAVLILAAHIVALDACAETNGVISCVADLASALEAERTGALFDFTATVTFPCNPICCTFAVEDKTGAIVLREDAFFPKCPMQAGDIVRLKGSTFRYKRVPNPAPRHPRAP